MEESLNYYGLKEQQTEDAVPAQENASPSGEASVEISAGDDPSAEGSRAAAQIRIPASASFREQIAAAFPHGETDIRSYSPLALAFLGDAVYSLIVRTALLDRGNRQAEKLHNESTYYVCAAAQAALADSLADLLTEEEAAVYRRGRNANPFHYARSASAADYRKATALECLCGWLWLQDRTERLLELIGTGLERTTGRI